jgi:hypothetical protein
MRKLTGRYGSVFLYRGKIRIGEVRPETAIKV